MVMSAYHQRVTVFPRVMIFELNDSFNMYNVYSVYNLVIIIIFILFIMNNFGPSSFVTFHLLVQFVFFFHKLVFESADKTSRPKENRYCV